MKKALVLFSGGKDSMLSSILLIEQGFQVYLVHYDNSFELGTKNVKNGFKRLEEKYGSDKVKYLGVKKIDGIFREFIKEFYNLKTNEISKKYGEITISEFNCLACRLSMYIETIIIANRLGISYVADGARKSQLFAIEQEQMLLLFTKLFKKYNINLLLPVQNLEDDFQEKNELLVRGFIPKVNESQCLIGTPLYTNSINNELVLSCINVYNRFLFSKIDSIIERYKNINFEGKYI